MGDPTFAGNGTDVPVEPIDAIASYYSTVTRITTEVEEDRGGLPPSIAVTVKA